MKINYTNRLKSLAWRLSVMILVVLINYALEYITGKGISTEITVLMGLIGGEITKALNQELSK